MLVSDREWEAARRRVDDGRLTGRQTVDVDAVSDALGVPVIPVIARRGEGIVAVANLDDLEVQGLVSEEIAWRAGDMFRFAMRGDVRVRIDRQFPLFQASEAHRVMERSGTRGKLLLAATDPE